MIARELLQLLLGVAIGVSAPAFAVWAVAQARVAWHAANARSREAYLTRLDDILYETEEWAAERTRRKIPTPSQRKLDHAVAQIMETLDGLSTKEAETLVHTHLLRNGLGASSKGPRA